MQAAASAVEGCVVNRHGLLLLRTVISYAEGVHQWCTDQAKLTPGQRTGIAPPSFLL